MKYTLVAGVALTFLLSACAAPRLQQPYETANELSKTNQAALESRCGNAGQQSVDCRRQVREEFEAQRSRNEAAAGR